jgi:hypothetical protein
VIDGQQRRQTIGRELDRRQDMLNVLRDSTREATDRVHFLRLSQTQLQPVALPQRATELERQWHLVRECLQHGSEELLTSESSKPYVAHWLDCRSESRLQQHMRNLWVCCADWQSGRNWWHP